MLARTTSIVFSILIVFLLTGCPVAGSPDGGGGVTYTLSGTLDCSSYASIDGKTGYVRLVTPGGNYSSEYLYSTTTTFDGAGMATYSITGIAEGSYKVLIFVDLDPGSTTPKPGDLDYKMDNFEMNAGKTLNVSDDAPSDWTLVTS